MALTHDQVLQSAREANRARGGSQPVPEVASNNPIWLRAQLTVLRKVVGPLRRRRQRDALPPPLSGEETARRLFELPVSYWSYDWQPNVRHLGPMSQDFAATFGLGGFARRIHMVDANGVAVVAIQSLHRTVTRLENEVITLRARVGELERAGQPTPDVSPTEQNGGPIGDTVEATGTHPDTQREATTMNENANPPVEDDVEGHKIYSGSDRTIKDDIAPVTWDDDTDDTEAHRFYNSDKTIKDDVAPVAWDEEAGDTADVEGHRFSSSDQTIKDDVAPVAWDEEAGDTADVEGHRFSSSDQTIKDDVAPVTWDDDTDDTEAHRFYSSDRTIKDDVASVAWAGDTADVEDTEGHRLYGGSDQTIKDDIAPVTWDDAEDTEGHRAYAGSDQTIKDDIAPVTWDDDTDDTEGHATRGKG